MPSDPLEALVDGIVGGFLLGAFVTLCLWSWIDSTERDTDAD